MRREYAMLKKYITRLMLSVVIIIGNAQASEITGAVIANALVTNQGATRDVVVNNIKNVYLMQVDLTEKEKKAIINFKPSVTQHTLKQQTSLPPLADLGMNGVPVLDQGHHGTNSTFATTAAVDALLGKGDYISQLCNLELGNYLEYDGYFSSGWHGSWCADVLAQMIGHGIINKQTQIEKSCAGVTVYPIRDRDNTGKRTPLNDFHPLSERMDTNFYWEPILSIATRVNDDIDHGYDPDKVLIEVKKALALHKVRLTFSVILPIDYCSAGACGRYHRLNDTWVLTHRIQNDPDPKLGGHAMVITGYDDEAIAIDDEDVSHTGLLTLRSSWGANVGDNGNYYMTYDFFKKYAIEIQKIVPGSGGQAAGSRRIEPLTKFIRDTF